MSEKNLKTRIVHKHDTETNWDKATAFIPKQGELIIYDVDENYSYERFKIGDGVHIPNALPFVNNIHISDTAPANPMVGQIWIDTSTTEFLSVEGVEF